MMRVKLVGLLLCLPRFVKQWMAVIAAARE